MPPRKQHPAPVAPPKVEATNIPLYCLLCPKRPSFSDVSHLLTHISSKSHLSNRFKAEIRSHKERDARETLRQFDAWYQRHGIQGLLADRMAAKDKKTGPKRSRAESPDPTSRAYNRSEAMIKPDPEPVSRQNTNGSLHAHSARQDYGTDDSPYRTPVTRRSQRLHTAKETSARELKSEPWAENLEVNEDGLQHEESIEAVAVGETFEKSKLKGVFWPGMSLFDSATEDQKRKRNQRKDATVLRRMEEVAAGVEPTEFIWSEDIDLQRTRDIYATPSVFGSPEPEAEEDAEPKKKRARRSTAAAKTGPRRQKRASTRVTRKKKAIKQEQEDDDHSVVDGEDTDGVLETTPVDDLNSEENLVSSSLTNSPDDGYDVFRDPPAFGSGQFDATIFQQYYYDPQLSSPALTWASSGHTDGSVHGMNFDPAARQALQPMSSNIAMASPTMNSLKHLPHLRRGHSEMSVPSHSPSQTLFYTHPHNVGQGNFNNPLAFSQGRSQLSYGSQFAGNDNLVDESKPLVSGFQPINLMHGLPFNPYNLSSGSNSYYTSSAPQNKTPDFEI